MKHPRGVPCHDCAPQDWKMTPNITGDFEMDASIMHAKAKRLHTDLVHHVKAEGLWNHTDPNAYHPRTAYRGYDGYHGDD